MKSISIHFQSTLLQSLLTVQPPETVVKTQFGFPDMTAILDYFDTSFNHDLALSSGIIQPEPGINPQLDEVSWALQQTQREFDQYLQHLRTQLNCP